MHRPDRTPRTLPSPPRRRARLVLAPSLLLALAGGGPPPAVAGDFPAAAPEPAGASGFTPVEIRDFATRLQQAVRADDAAQVATLVAFPLRINRPGSRPRQIGRGEFLRRYAEIFTPQLRRALLAQDPGALFENWQGVMFGDGEAWAAGVCAARRCTRGKLRLTVVNAAP